MARTALAQNFNTSGGKGARRKTPRPAPNPLWMPVARCVVWVNGEPSLPMHYVRGDLQSNNVQAIRDRASLRAFSLRESLRFSAWIQKQDHTDDVSMPHLHNRCTVRMGIDMHADSSLMMMRAKFGAALREVQHPDVWHFYEYIGYSPERQQYFTEDELATRLRDPDLQIQLENALSMYAQLPDWMKRHA